MPPHRRRAWLFFGLLGMVGAACGPTKAGIETDGAADIIQGSDACACADDTPVCGADGNTYASACVAACASVNVASQGICPIDAAPPDSGTRSGSGGATPSPGSGGRTGSGGSTGAIDAAPPDQAGADLASDGGGMSSADLGGGGAPMQLTCDFQSPCQCPAGQDCQITCPGGGCMVDCGDGATCTIDCSGGGCMTMCGVGAACAPTCGTAGGCDTTCANDARCDVVCLGGGCMSDCTAPGATCTVSCEGMGCFTMCQDATSSCNVSCNAGCPLKCGDSADCFVNCRADPDSCQVM